MSQVIELDPQEFINQAQGDAPSDERVVTPEGEYRMYIKPGSTKILEGTSDKGKWRKYTAVAVVDDANVRAATNLEEPSARIQFFLDVNESGSLVIGTNRNTTLGALLKATGNQKQGWTYGEIEGVGFTGRVKHIADRRNSEKMYPEVVAFAK